VVREWPHAQRIGPVLCWALVFADVGSSVYYVPGILHDTPGVGHLAALFVLVVSVTSVFLAAKIADIAARYPGGGGVVNMATDAFGPLAGCLGGILITIDYFLTASMGAASGVRYLSSVLPLGHLAVPIACVVLAILGLINLLGVRQSAATTLVMAIAGLVTQVAVVLLVLARLTPGQWRYVWSEATATGTLSPRDLLVGFGAAWLAFSGLESLSQISPALRAPRRRVANVAIALVFGSVLATAPLLTAFSTVLLDGTAAGAAARSDRLISSLADAVGGTPLRVLTVIAASSLLLFSANTAIVGCYHVLCALQRRGYMPAALATRSRPFGTPHVAIGVATLAPVLIVLFVDGSTDRLGGLYAFGLLGAFFLSSAGLDCVRWRERRRGVSFWVGTCVSLAVLVAWFANLLAKHQATLFGALMTAIGLTTALTVRRGRLAPGAGVAGESCLDRRGD